jgi:hypothetical protein
MTILFSDISGVPMIGEQISSTSRNTALFSVIVPILTEQLIDPYCMGHERYMGDIQ